MAVPTSNSTGGLLQVLADVLTGNTGQLGGALPGGAVATVHSFFLETVAALGASAVYTGGWRDALFYNAATAVALTDAAGGTLLLDEADALTPSVTNLIAKAAVAPTDAQAPAPPAAGQQAVIRRQGLGLRYVRVRFINGATLQTRLAIQSALSPL